MSAYYKHDNVLMNGSKRAGGNLIKLNDSKILSNFLRGYYSRAVARLQNKTRQDVALINLICVILNFETAMSQYCHLLYLWD